MDKRTIEKKIQRWVNSPEGQASIRKSIRLSEGMSNELNEARKVGPDTLHGPMTI